MDAYASLDNLSMVTTKKVSVDCLTPPIYNLYDPSISSYMHLDISNTEMNNCNHCHIVPSIIITNIRIMILSTTCTINNTYSRIIRAISL